MIDADSDPADDSPTDIIDGTSITKTVTGRRKTIDVDGPRDISLVGAGGLAEETTAYRLLQDIRHGEYYLSNGGTDRVVTALNQLHEAPTDTDQ